MTKYRWELSAVISENFEITCLKRLKNHTCTPVKQSVTNENFIFFSASKEVKCYQNWLKNGVELEFYCPFLTSSLMMNLFT